MDKMKRLSNMLLVSAMLVTGWAQAEPMPMVAAEDLAANLGAMEMGDDDATRGCNIKHFGKIIACDVVAGNGTFDNLRVNNDLTVFGDEEIAGDLIVRGDIIVFGDYVPLTFNLLPGTDVIGPVIDGLSNDDQNFGSVLINLAPGVYNESDFTFIEDIQDLTMIGDTHPLAGVAFMQGGIYGGPSYNVQFQLNPEIGLGCNYNIGFDASGTIATVTTDTIACTDFTAVNPDFTGLVGHEVVFTGIGGIPTTYTVLAVAGNTITFDSPVGGVVVGTAVSTTTSTPGVAFVVIPNVRINGPAGTSSFVGFDNLKLQGIYFSWEIGNVLYLGGVNTKMELSNNLLKDQDAGPDASAIIISANQAYNRQPNLFWGRPQIIASSTPDFIFNSVWGGPGLQIFGASGNFSYAQFSASSMDIQDGSRIIADYSRFFNILPGVTAISLFDASTLSLDNGTVQNSGLSAGANGIIVANSSTLNAPNIIVMDFVTGLNVETASAGILFGVSNPANFSGNTVDLELDGDAVTFISINTLVPGVPSFGTSFSYAIR